MEFLRQYWVALFFLILGIYFLTTKKSSVFVLGKRKENFDQIDQYNEKVMSKVMGIFLILQGIVSGSTVWVATHLNEPQRMIQILDYSSVVITAVFIGSLFYSKVFKPKKSNK